MKKQLLVLSSLLFAANIYADVNFRDEASIDSNKNYKTAYEDWYESESVPAKLLPFERFHTLSLNARVYIPSSVGVFISYDYSILKWLSLGAGFGYNSGGTPHFSYIPFSQIVFPIYANFYLLSTPDYKNRWVLSANVEPFIEFDAAKACDSLDYSCNPVPKKNYGGVYLGGGTGYEYRNEDGLVIRLTALILVPVPNPTVKYYLPTENAKKIHYAVVPTVQFSLGYAF